MAKGFRSRGAAAVGLELRPKGFRLACLARDGQGFTLLHQEERHLQPTDEGFLQMAVAVRQSLDSRRIRPGRLVVGLARPWCFLKFITMPAMAREDVGGALGFELERHLPVDPASLIYEHTVVSERPGQDMTVLVGAARRPLIESLLSALQARELEPSALVPAPFANAAFVEVSRPELARAPRCLLVEETARAVAADLFERGRLTSSQFFTLEGEPSDEALAGLEKELIRGLSPTLRASGPPEALPWALLGPADGPASRALGSLGLPAPTPVRPGAAIRQAPEGDEALFHTAVGLACLARRDEPAPISLMPRAAEVAPAPRRLPRRAVLLGVAALTALGLYGALNLRHQWELSRLREAVEALRPQVEAVNRLQGEIGRLRAQSEAVEALVGRNPNALEVVRELTLVIPSSAWLTEVNYNGRELLIGGYAQSSQELIGLLEESALFANIEFRGTITKRDGKERFKIAAQME